MNKKAVIVSTLCCLLTTQPVFAEENKPEKPSFKERVQAILSESPFSVFWDADADDISAGDQELFAEGDTEAAKASLESEEQEALDIQDDLLTEAASYRQQLEAIIAELDADKKAGLNQEQALVAETVQEKSSNNKTPRNADANYIFDVPKIEIVQDASLGESLQRSDDSLLLEYRSGVVNKVYSCPGYVTDIQLQLGEQIQRITTGDKSRWNIDTFYSDVLDGGRWHIYLRPLQLGLETNIIISTDRHNYQIIAATDTLYNPIVEWKYPDEVSEYSAMQREKRTKTLEVDSVDKLNFSYVISKANRYSWTPNFVFDDGFRTYINIPEDVLHKINPALFMVNQDGTLVFVNYLISNGNLVVDTIGTEFQLRVKDQVVRIRRD